MNDKIKLYTFEWCTLESLNCMFDNTVIKRLMNPSISKIYKHNIEVIFWKIERVDQDCRLNSIKV